jgi:predicted nucleic acid-binding protein
MTATAIVDTNILVYAFDGRDPRKQRIAAEVILDGAARDTIRIPHQALIEFYSVTTRLRYGQSPILAAADAAREINLMLQHFPILYPDASVLRTALRGVVEHQLSWFDAHLWAYAETYGIAELLSEDFQHGRVYGSVRATDPFR